MEKYFDVLANHPVDMPKVEIEDGALVGRFYEASELEGHARFEIAHNAGIVTLPRPAVTMKSNPYYLRARTMYRIVLHVKTKMLVQGIEYSVRLRKEVAPVLQLTAFYFRPDGIIELYVMPLLPIQVSLYFPLALIEFKEGKNAAKKTTTTTKQSPNVDDNSKAVSSGSVVETKKDKKSTKKKVAGARNEKDSA